MQATPLLIRRWAVAAGLVLGCFAGTREVAAAALPFDPVPSSFQRWLNSRSHWPHNEQRRFEALAECADQTAANSPYRMPVYTCLKGSVSLQRPGLARQQCQIQRVSYFPQQQRIRLWTHSCR